MSIISFFKANNKILLSYLLIQLLVTWIFWYQGQKHWWLFSSEAPTVYEKGVERTLSQFSFDIRNFIWFIFVTVMLNFACFISLDILLLKKLKATVIFLPLVTAICFFMLLFFFGFVVWLAQIDVAFDADYWVLCILIFISTLWVAGMNYTTALDDIRTEI